MNRAIELLDPWQKVLNIPCWRPFMWETILSYGSSYNENRLREIATNKYRMEELVSPNPWSSNPLPAKSALLVVPCEP